MANQISVNTGSGSGAQQVIVDSNGNITVTVSRSVIGTVANVASANYANFAGTVLTNAQPNITSVGTLSNLTVANTITTNNLVVTGNFQVGNLVANSANYANFAGTAFAVAGANVSGAVANATFATTAGSANTANSATVANSANSVAGANVSGTVANATFATTAGSANTANTATVANSANAVAGANVSGAVANATYADNAGNANFANSATVASSANSVTLANVSGAGNIASINLDGSGSNVLYGNGIFAPAAGGNTANANYANFAGNAFSVDGGNVVGAVANATFALDAGNANIANIAYSVDGANVSGAVANATFALDAGNANISNIAYSVDAANVSGLGNIATVNLDGNVSNLLTGNGTFVAIPTGGANANYANFAGTVLTNAQPNITSVGTLTGLTVSSNANVTIESINNTARLQVTANANGFGTQQYWNGTHIEQLTQAGASEFGFTVTTANTNPGNTFPTNLKGVWRFESNGNLSHLIGGTGNINAKGANISGNIFTTGTIAGTGAISSTVSLTAPNITANTGIFTGNAAGLTNIPGANVTGTVANATYANDSGNANIANIAYSVDAANVTGLGNIAVINLDGNASNFLDGTGNFVAAPGGANANYANFAGTVLTNAQPNITSVGNLSALTVTGNLTSNTITRSNVIIYNGNVAVNDKITVQADLPGAGAVRNLGIRGGNISNASPSNTTSGGVFFNSGQSVSADTGNVFIARTGTVAAATGTANTANGSAFSGGFQLTPGAAIANNGNATAGVLFITAGGATANNGNAIISNSIIGGASGNATNGNVLGGTFTIQGANARTNTSGNAQAGNLFIFGGNATSNNGSATSGNISISTLSANAFGSGTATVGSITLEVGTANGITANVRGNINIGTGGFANAVNIGATGTPVNVAGNLNVVGRVDSLRTFGEFTSNVTQTSNGANTTNYMTFNNTEDATGVSIVSSTQLTVARTGRYNLQFSAQLTHDTNATANIEIWLTKNGSAIANTNSRLSLAKDQPTIAAWNWLDNASTANTYYEIAWASPDTNMEIIAYDTANTISGVAIPSIIATITPVGA